jgi:hypothetical protein
MILILHRGRGSVDPHKREANAGCVPLRAPNTLAIVGLPGGIGCEGIPVPNQVSNALIAESSDRTLIDHKASVGTRRSRW